MKLNKNFIIHDRNNEVMLVPTFGAGFSGIVKGNKTFGAILKYLKYDVSKQDIISSLKSEFFDDNGLIEADVEKTIEQLKKIGAIDE